MLQVNRCIQEEIRRYRGQKREATVEKEQQRNEMGRRGSPGRRAVEERHGTERKEGVPRDVCRPGAANAAFDENDVAVSKARRLHPTGFGEVASAVPATPELGEMNMGRTGIGDWGFTERASPVLRYAWNTGSIALQAVVSMVVQ